MQGPTLAAVALATLLAACATAPLPPTSPAVVGERLHGSGFRLVNGYLSKSEHLDSLALLPAPPAAGSAAVAADTEAYRALTALRNTPQGVLATRDAKLSFPATEETTFSCALGIPISEVATPHLNILLRRVMTDGGSPTFGAKNHYKRTRPFVEFKEASCTPDEEHILARDGSYPSGHSASGWAQALVLAELAPERSDALLQRGRAYGQSRAICGAHWASDVVAGRVVAAGVVPRLQLNPVFRAQMQAAREEIAKMRASGRKPASDCAAEAAALATTSRMAP